MKKIYLLIVLIIFAGCTLTVSDFTGGDDNVKVMRNEVKQFKVKGIKAFQISSISGSITILPAQDNILLIEAEAFSNNETNLGKIKMVETRAADMLRIHTKFTSKIVGRGGINYKVFLPEGVTISKAASISGRIFIENISSVKRISTTSGDIIVAGCSKKIDISTVSGNTYLSKHKGTAKISSTSGDQFITNVEGNCILKTVSGDITPLLVLGDISANAVSGDIKVTDLIGKLSSSTVSGEILAKGNITIGEIGTTSGGITMEISDLGATSLVESTTGDITLRLIALTDITIEYDTSRGKADIDIHTTSGPVSPGSGSVVIGDGTRKLSISSSSGNITIKERVLSI